MTSVVNCDAAFVPLWLYHVCVQWS